MTTKALEFKPLTPNNTPPINKELLLFLHNIWMGYDEIISGTFDGSNFYHYNKMVRKRDITGWLELPIKIAYESTDQSKVS